MALACLEQAFKSNCGNSESVRLYQANLLICAAAGISFQSTYIANFTTTIIKVVAYQLIDRQDNTHKSIQNIKNIPAKRSSRGRVLLSNVCLCCTIHSTSNDWEPFGGNDERVSSLHRVIATRSIFVSVKCNQNGLIENYAQTSSNINVIAEANTGGRCIIWSAV